MPFFLTRPGVRAGLLSLLAGVAYSIAAPMYAKACYAAPGNQDKLPTTLELVYFLPATAFALMGVACLTIGFVMLFNDTHPQNKVFQ